MDYDTSDKILCIHCLNTVRKDDTTCIHCGGEIEQIEELKSFRPFVLIGCAFWVIVGLICYFNGWLV